MNNIAFYEDDSASRQNLFRLGLIRAVVIIGQAMALAYFSWIKPINLPVISIAVVLAIYASVTIATANRGRVNIPITDREFFIHLLVDIFFFSTLLYLSGGASNPFISYYLISISIAAIALPWGYSAVISVITLVCYSLLLSYHIPVSAIAPHNMGHSMAGNNLHIWGMWANFVISAAIITYFVSRMASELKNQQQKMAEHREQQLQDEQLLAIGTLAAGTAHELGTPLNTMKLLVDEMLIQQKKNPDLDLLSQQIDQCRTTLKQLQTTANESSTEVYSPQLLHIYFDQLFERWQLMRPELKTTISYADCLVPAPELKFHPTIAQSILNLLNNAADASPESVDVSISWTDTEIEIQIKDCGEGFDTANITKPFFSSKSEGLGLGLFLSQSTVTRFGGSVNLQNLTDGGTLTTINLPINLTVKSEDYE
ncbi:MAG: ATP-binding protein [Porticoccaceae bacterium]|jgi:two-component system sensor histidine kinase RegB